MNHKCYLIEFLSDRLGYGPVVITGTKGKGIYPGITAVTGPNGSGKTTLGTILEKGRYAFGNRISFAEEGMKIRMLTFTDIHSFTGIDVARYDQRLEATENELVPTVAEIMGDTVGKPQWQDLCALLKLHDVISKRINYLSSGELRKLLVIHALLAEPDILVLDNPYIGLDTSSRAELNRAICQLRDHGASIILLIADPAEIPASADTVVTLDCCRITGEITDPGEIASLRMTPPADTTGDISLPPPPVSAIPHEIAFAIHDGHIRYGAKSVIEGLDWEVRSGERWTLTGPNGSGKSLLLSMVYGDNPQAYANHITIFDRRRGSGESIWDIKDNIGYVCPEMQLYFRSGLNVEGIVVEGMRPVMKRYGRPAAEELECARRWLAILGISHTADRLFSQLSSAEQRLVLLARAFIRQPAMLILDEPFQGLDPGTKERLRRVIDRLVESRGSTLIFVTHYPAELPTSVTHTKTLGSIPSGQQPS